MKEKLLKFRYIVFILFAVKMFIYYTAVDIPVFSGVSYWVTMAFFALTLFLYCNSTPRTKKVLNFVYVIFSVVLFIDVIYYNYFNQLVSVNQIWQIKNMKGTGESVKSAIPLMSILILVDIPILWWVRRKLRSRLGESKSRNLSLGLRRLMAVGLVLCVIMIAVNPFRWAYLQKINSTEAVTVHIKDVVESTVGKVIYKQSSLGTILQKKSVTSKDVAKVAQGIAGEMENNDSAFDLMDAYAGIGRGKNLIVIQVESMQNFVIGAEYEGQELTPNLNKLLREDTLYFNHFYTNMGKGNTSDAEFSMQTSMYPVIEGASYDLYVDNAFKPLPMLMKEKGYTTSAAIGDDKDFYNRAVVYEKFGYDYFYNEDNLEMDEISGLGLSDKSMFAQMADQLAASEAPFYSFIITLTNHFPYVLEETFASPIELKAEDEGTLFGGYMQTIRYTDEALGAFIEALKENGLYEDTIIAIYGDHHGLNCLDAENNARMTEYLGYTYDYDSMLNIPLIIHIPGLEEARTVETVGGQVDFLPTIANLFELDLSDSVIFGQDLLNAEEGFVATVAYMLQGSFIKDGVLYEIGRDSSFEDGRAIDLDTHQSLPLDGLEEYSSRAVTVTELSKYILEHDQALTSADHLSKILETAEDELESEK